MDRHPATRHRRPARGVNGDPALLTTREVAEMLRVSTMTVYRLIKAGDLPACRVGRQYRIDSRAAVQMVAPSRC